YRLAVTGRPVSRLGLFLEPGIGILSSCAVRDSQFLGHWGLPMTVLTVFTRCVEAIRKGVLIKRESRRDKEFHFQDWFRDRLTETRLHFEQGRRNSYPDFRMV